MPELAAGMLVGMLLAALGGLDVAGSFIVGGIAALALYMASCYVWPYRRCGWCEGRDTVGDGRGNFRLRWTSCWWCHGQKPNRRFGARLMGRG